MVGRLSPTIFIFNMFQMIQFFILLAFLNCQSTINYKGEGGGLERKYGLNLGHKKYKYIIQGEVKDLNTGYVYLYKEFPIVSDSSKIVNGKFKFTGYVSEPEFGYIRLKDDYYVHDLILEGGKSKVTMRLSDHMFKIVGGIENEYQNEFRESVKYISDSLHRADSLFSKALKERNINTYLSAYNAVKRVEGDYLKQIRKQFQNNKQGHYLLSAINAAGIISYSYFSERKLLMEMLSNQILSTKDGIRISRLLKEQTMGDKVLIGKEGFNFKLVDTLGKNINLLDYRGRYVLIDFWASWCEPCVKELPLLNEIYSDLESDSVEFISISVDTETDKWKTSVGQKFIKWPSLIADHETKLQYEISSVPNKILVSKDGRVIGTNMSLAEVFNYLNKSNPQDKGH